MILKKKEMKRKELKKEKYVEKLAKIEEYYKI